MVASEMHREAVHLCLVAADELLEGGQVTPACSLQRPWIRIKHPATPRLLLHEA
jgi:hypothetical protein